MLLPDGEYYGKIDIVLMEVCTLQVLF